jgi:hypothetical protein
MKKTIVAKRTIREKLQELKKLQKRNAKRREEFKKVMKK